MKKLKVLVACEYSGAVRDAFIRAGHEAMSCDLLPTDAPGPHYQGDVRDVLQQPWDILIAHPPCTYLSSSGLHWNRRGVLVDGRPRAELTEEGIAFARLFIDGPETAHIPMRAVENPIGCLSTRVRKPDQIIHPYQFGHDASKATCLWLHGLPLLAHTVMIGPRWVCCGVTLPEGVGKYGCPSCHGEKKPLPRWGNQTDSGQNKLPPTEDRWKIRSETFSGIAEAMAMQWGGLSHANDNRPEAADQAA